MRTTLLPARARRARLLYAGLAVFVLLGALTARAVWRAWDQRAGQARTVAVFQLVQQRMPSRPTEAPGAIAWLREQLVQYREHLGADEASAFGRLSDESDFLPSELAATAAAMRGAAVWRGDGDALPQAVRVDRGQPSRRSVSVLHAAGSAFVVTRRRALDHDASSNAFVRGLAAPMGAARARLEEALAGIARPVRLYALGEDGTLLSMPWPPAEEGPDATASGEAHRLSTRPTLPSFAPEEFFFRFGDDDYETVRYSGFYLDLGGRGLVSTVTMPIEGATQAGVLALDLAHAVDWDRFASTIAPPVAASIVRTNTEAPTTWMALRSALPTHASAPLRVVLNAIVERGGTRPAAVSPITHAVVPDSGAVAAFQVGDRAWLLTFFPSATPSFPAGAVALLGAVLAVLLTGFEMNRRKAEREADRAARALDEKQNLLNTMQVPLVVVDPNTDTIVSANQVAESIGIRRGARFADRVSDDPRARAHYERTQVVTGEARRAYGVPIRVDAGSGQVIEQFAMVRSVAVTAPIEALGADERHRLAILFLVDPQSDLRLLLDEVEEAAHTDERRRLAGLLSHGLTSLAEVLRRNLAREDGSAPLSRWLADYLQRRIHVTAWLLDHWDSSHPPHDSVVDAAQAHETLASLERILVEVRNDADVRARLEWSNGPLSAAADNPPFALSINWPDEYETTLPVRGGLGFFLTEVLSNAMRHGAPGTVPRVMMRCDRIRQELDCAVENERREHRPPASGRYGGVALLAGMARLFGWSEFCAAPTGSRFLVTWRVPLTRRDHPGRPD